MATLILMCGLPGAGKTTVAKRLERERPAMLLSPDEWMQALGFDLFDEEQRARIEALQGDLAMRMLEQGIDVVLDWGFWGRDERDAFREKAASMGCGSEIRYVDAPREVLLERILARNQEPAFRVRSITEADLDEWTALFQRPTEDELRPIRAQTTHNQAK